MRAFHRRLPDPDHVPQGPTRNPVAEPPDGGGVRTTVATLFDGIAVIVKSARGFTN
jgi:hypothetical protein